MLTTTTPADDHPMQILAKILSSVCLLLTLITSCKCYALCRYITCPSIPLGSDKNTYKKHSCDSLFLLYEQHNFSGFKVRVGAILLLPLPLHQLPPQPARLLHVVPIGGRPPSKLVSPVLCVTSTSTCRVLSSFDLDSIFVTILCQNLFICSILVRVQLLGKGFHPSEIWRG